MTYRPGLITWPAAPCCTSEDFCVCGVEERRLRAWIDGKPMPTMTDEQREWCLEEIDQIEGYKRADHATEADADLARTVLSAWTAFCRDKGLL